MKRLSYKRGIKEDPVHTCYISFTSKKPNKKQKVVGTYFELELGWQKSCTLGYNIISPDSQYIPMLALCNNPFKIPCGGSKIPIEF